METMKSLLITFVICIASLIHTGVQAIIIEFDPINPDVNLGDSINVDLVVSGLGDSQADSLGTFDLDVVFDPAILSFSDVAFGDPVLGDQLDLFGLGSISFVTPLIGFVNLYELSLDFESDLNSLQASEFTLATLTFNTLSIGESSLTIGSSAILGDAAGKPLILENDPTATITVSAAPVPEPATLVLLSTGLVGLVGAMRRRRSR